jgi:lantibiotic modifying enzyme
LAICLLEDYAKFAATQASPFSAWLSTVEEGGLPKKWAAPQDFPCRFLASYPVAKRAFDAIVTAAVGFAERLQRSMKRHNDTIVATLGNAFALDRLLDAATSMGDFHGGQCTICLQYLTGEQAYWKPRSALPEAAFYALWFHLQHQLGWEPEATPTIVQLGDTHLVEHVGRRLCADRHLYWEKSGALLALATLLGVRDLHNENVVAAASCPMPVDLEVMLSEFHETQGGATFEPFDVYRTGLLPCQSDEPEFPEIGGLFSSATLSRTRFVDVSGRDRRIGAQVVMGPRNPTENNIPIGEDGMCSQQDLKRLSRGYANGVRALDNAFSTICNAEIMSKLEDVQPRLIVIGTQGYYRILRGASQPHLMRDEAAYEAFLMRSLEEELQRRGRRLSPCKRESTILALRSWDIPLHKNQSFATGSKRGELAHVLSRRISEMQRSLAMQEHLITVCGLSRTRGFEGVPVARRYTSVEDAIEDVYASLHRLVFREARGIVVVGLRERKSINADPWTLVDELGPGYYAGRSGVALAFSAYGRVKCNQAAVETALALLTASVRDYDNLPEKDFSDPDLYGIDEGIAGLVYALSIAKRLLPQHACNIVPLFERIWPHLERLTIPGHYNRGRKDVLTGESGIILALLAAGQTFGLAPASLASRLATQLLGEPQQTTGAGMLHGASGIAFALLRVFEATGDRSFLQAAREYLEQDDVFLRRNQHAREGRSDVSWCHGILGNLAAKALYGRVTSDSAYSQDATEKLTSLREQVPNFSNAAVCCGSFGLVLFEQVLRDYSGASHASAGKPEDVGRAITMQSLKANWRATGGNVPLAYSAGLYTGLSGVLYGLLRSVDGALPNFSVFD